jgi:hypothetical protein
MTKTETKPKPSSFHQAAQANWVAPIVAIAANYLWRQGGPSDGPVAIIGLMLLALYGLGLVLGVVALTGIPAQGRRGILVPALIGIFVNVAILTISFSIVASASD